MTKVNSLSASPDEKKDEISLRPLSLNDFWGQKDVVNQLKIFISAANLRQEPLDHVLISGPPGLGKTTLSHIISKEMDVQLHLVSGPLLEKPSNLVGILTSLNEKDILFIDEIHRIPPIVEEYLYSAMEDFSIDIIVDKGPHARSLHLQIPPFTLIGATTRSGLLTSPLRSRFGVIARLDFYKPEELAHIILRSAKILDISIDIDSAMEIARRSRGTARIANRMLRRVRDYSQVHGNGHITIKIAKQAAELLNIDKNGLDELDKAILNALIKKFNGGPVGIKNLAMVIGEEKDTLESVYEPYLIKEGFIKRTPSGRKVTNLGYEALGLTPQMS